MTLNEDLFKERYDKLNERQKEAVDTIYGAVMVIAGPGTGKTEVLSMRIANLMRSDAQVQPQEILCLTYTDEATNSMRRRLVQITGPAAHKVNIYTFHAFCNNVIQNNSEYFSQRPLQHITDLERTDLIYKLLETLPQGHLLRRFSGNIYLDAGKLNKLFDTMKREYLSPQFISDAIDEYIKDLPNRDGYTYKKKYKEFKAGDLKQDKVDDEVRKMEFTRAAALLFDKYEEMMKAEGLYDYNDMIIWVLRAFKENPALLVSYQERYQFVLVDEFQDTNGSQSELINYLSSYWESPNIFVVGDDDQGVYEFQGARIRNIAEFYYRHRDDIKVIVLPHNYRSSQPILDKAMATINFNQVRLVTQLQELALDKNIISASERFADKKEEVQPVIKAYKNTIQEEADIVLQIEALQKKGVALSDVAIIYAQHKQAENIIDLMEKKGIPYNAKKPVNVLTEPLIEQVLNILRYLDQERKRTFDGEAALFELLHAPYFGIYAADIAQLALYLQHHRKEKGPTRWRTLLNNALLLESLELRSAKALVRIGNCLDNWEQQQLSLPLPLLLEKIFHESGLIAHIIRTPDHVWTLQVLYTFFDFVKETYNRNPRLKPAVLLEMIERMNLEKLSVPMQRVIQNEDGVYCYTAHSSKGNEFEYVFLIGCTKNFWEDKKGGGNEFRMPDTITSTDDDAQNSNKTEVARRLFYVALTRAKKYLTVSYANNDNNGKALSNSVFVDEISLPEERQSIEVESAELTAAMALAMTQLDEVRIKMANGKWIDRELTQYTMSASSLTKFVTCPLAFYYENILKVPFQKNDALAFGSAVHTALERMFLEMKLRKGVFPDKEWVINVFRSALFSEQSCFTPVQYDRRSEQGETLLSEYYDHYINTFSKDVEIEFKVPRYMLDGVPVTGKIDRIELSGDSCKVIDYKTGDPDKSATPMTAPPNEKEPLGGDYWRQMVFYKLLLEHYEAKSWKVTLGMFDFVQKNKNGEYKQVVVPVYAQDEEIVRAQIKDSYTRIMNHEFDRGCGKETCHWCNFARRYELIRPEKDEVVEIDDM